MSNILLQKPCVVETPQGFSVSYNNHFLYSKYNPSKTIIQTINNLSLLPGTIILCNSPVLDYGLKELYAKLPENCLMILCEADEELCNFATQYNSAYKTSPVCKGKALNNLPLIIYDYATQGIYKRVIRIDFSAGVQFHSAFYDQVFEACSNSISTFWKNRITLTKFGRRYSHNLYKNLKLIPESTPITNFIKKITKPILVFGAGQSLDTFIKSTKLNFSDFFVLAVDTAVQPLQKYNIIPDGVFIEEAQSVISKAFIGTSKTIHYFAGLSSIPFLYKNVPPNKLSFFATEYTTGRFFSKLTELQAFPPVNKPFGSVGLTAVYYALQFRKNESVPVYFTGLDFSYSAGITHAKNTIAHIGRLTAQNRTLPVANYGASFNNTTTKLTDKNKNVFFSTPTLLSYANLFNNLFAYEQNLYDCSESGVPLSVMRAKPIVTSAIKDTITIEPYSKQSIQELKAFLAKEKNELELLRDILTGKIELSAEEQEKQITELISSKEYLYLHFADGFKYSYTQSFLNRVRTEIDFFLKVF